MSVYRKRAAEPYTYDFWVKGIRFTGTTGCTDKRQAEKFEEAERRRIKAEQRTMAAPTAAKVITIAEAASKFFDECAQFHKNSVDAERYLLWIAENVEGGPDLPLTKIDNAIVTKLVAKRRGTLTTRGTLPSNATINRHTEYFRMMMNQAKSVWKVAVQDVDWKKFKLKERKVQTEASPEQEAFLIDTIRGDYAPALRFALLSGCRLEEIVGLKWAHVRFHSRDFTVWGKGKHNEKKEGVIPMSRAIYALLWELKDDHPEFVFTYVCKRTRDGRKKDSRYPITYEGLKTEWRRMKTRCEKAGVSFNAYRFHDNRHTAATRLLRKTGNLKMVQQMLRHDRLETTARYGHVLTEDLRRGMDAVSPSENPSKRVSVSK